MTLNGWQRLWIVSAAIWALLVAIFTSLTLPPTDAELIHEWASAKVQLMKRYHGQGETDEAFRARTYSGASDEDIVHPAPAPWKKFDPRTAVPADESEAIDRQYQEALAAKTPRSALVLNAILVWFIPSAGVYLLGMAVRWVRAGFTNGKASA
jgi:hypothetical protein